MIEQWIPKKGDEVVATTNITEKMLDAVPPYNSFYPNGEIIIPEGTYGNITNIYQDGNMLVYSVEWDLWQFERFEEDGSEEWEITDKSWMKLREETDDA